MSTENWNSMGEGNFLFDMVVDITIEKFVLSGNFIYVADI